MTYNIYKILGFLILFFGASSCNFKIKEQAKIEDPKQYIGWWVYGEGQHILKDEESLEEWDLEFPNENMKELEGLYLAVCEMEYFPMESKMTGRLMNDILEVTDFEITYIQGCGEE